MKLLGKSIGFHTMRDRLHRIWKLLAGFELMDIGHGYFMVKFDLEGDRTKVMEEGPWMIFDHYLTVQRWTPEFASPTAKIDETMVWIRFSGLNVFYYDESILWAMASAVGTPIKVDSNTLDVRRGRYARVCVQIDLNKPVIGKVWMRNFWYKVEYEGLHRICSTCGCYGHLSRECRTEARPIVVHTTAAITHKEGVTAANHQEGETTTPLKEGGNQTNQNPSVKQGTVTDSTGNSDSVTKEKEDPLHGDWLVVRKKNRKRTPNNGKNLKDSKSNHGANHKGSRNNHAGSKINANVVLKQNRVPADVAVKFNPVNVNLKRPRQDQEWVHQPMKPTKPIIPAPTKPNSDKNKGPVIYEVGQGVKSTVNMKACAPNHFVMYDEGVANDQEVVLETQLSPDAMVT